MTTTIRQKRIKPRLVRVAPGGYAPELLWGMPIGPRRDGLVTVVTVRATPFAPPQVLRVPVTHVTQACLMTAPDAVLANFVRHNVLSQEEYAEWSRVRLMGRLNAEAWMRDIPESKARRALRPWANIGKGALSKQARKFLR